MTIKEVRTTYLIAGLIAAHSFRLSEADSVLRSQQGSLLAIAAFSCWGAFPFYFKLVTHIPPLEVLASRVVWSAVALLLLLLIFQQWRNIKNSIPTFKQGAYLLMATLLLASNWGIYIWSVTSNQLFEASLGYYINPLVNVVLGFVILRERLRPIQWFAVLLAAIGVGIQMVNLGKLPWIALALGFSFGFYGLIHKQVDIDEIPGLLVETLLLLPLALLFLGYLGLEQAGPGDWSHSDWWLLALVGPVTVIPLLLFTAAARRITYTSLGFFLYITPSMLFLLASLVYKEAFSQVKLTTFAFIWTALIIISIDAIRQQRLKNAAEKLNCV